MGRYGDTVASLTEELENLKDVSVEKTERIEALERQFEETIDFLNCLAKPGILRMFRRRKRIKNHLVTLWSSDLFDFKVIDDKD